MNFKSAMAFLFTYIVGPDGKVDYVSTLFTEKLPAAKSIHISSLAHIRDGSFDGLRRLLHDSLQSVTLDCMRVRRFQ